MNTPFTLARSSLARILALCAFGLALAAIAPRPAQAVLLRTYITGEYMGDPVIFKARFDPAVKDSLILSIVVTDVGLGADGGRMDNIDFVPGSGFSKVIVTTQYSGAAPDGGVREYDVIGGAPPVDIVASTNGIAVPPASGITRPASIVPNDAGSHYYYVENQFGFDGGTHRIIRVPVAGGGGEAVVFDGTAGVIGGGTLVEFSGVEIVDDTLYFFARNATTGPPDERQLYSVPLVAGIGVGAATMEVGGLDRSSKFTAAGPGDVGPGASDGSDELDYDPVSGLLYGTNHATGETIGFNPVTDTMDFYIPGAAVTAAATAPPGTLDGLGMLAGVATPDAASPAPIFGPPRRIDGIRPTDDGDWLVVIGHEGVVASIDASTGMVLRLFNKDVALAGLAPGLDRAAIGFDDHTLLAPALIPEPTTAMLGVVGMAGLLRRRRRVN